MLTAWVLRHTAWMPTFSCNKPTFSCQILIIFSFLESLSQKGTDCTSFEKEFLQIISIQPVKRNLHIISFPKLHIGLFKILLNFLHIWKGMVEGILKMNILPFFGDFFYYFTEFCKKFSKIVKKNCIFICRA